MRGRMCFGDHFIEYSGFGYSRSMEMCDIDSDLQHSNPPRTKQEYPYSFDPHTVWGGPTPKGNCSDWADRLHGFDPEKYEAVGKEVFGDGQWFGEGLSGTRV